MVELAWLWLQNQPTSTAGVVIEGAVMKAAPATI